MKRLVMLGVIALAVVTCDSGPQAGEVVLSLVSPNSQDGAVSFRLTAVEGETIASLSADCSGCKVFAYKVSDTEMLGVVTGQLAPGPVVRAMVSNVKKPERYSATVRAAASRTYAVRNTAGYTIEVDKP